MTGLGRMNCLLAEFVTYVESNPALKEFVGGFGSEVLGARSVRQGGLFPDLGK